MKTFDEVWAEKEREGYQYGEDALEQVRFGWELAHKAHGEAAIGDDGKPVPYDVATEWCQRMQRYAAAFAKLEAYIYRREVRAESPSPDEADVLVAEVTLDSSRRAARALAALRYVCCFPGFDIHNESTPGSERWTVFADAHESSSSDLIDALVGAAVQCGYDLTTPFGS